VVGADTHFELWDAAAWERYLEETEPRFADLPADGLLHDEMGLGRPEGGPDPT